jgi:Protein of unknown function (DUF3135)
MATENSEFPFDFWANLAQSDPAAFEEARKLMLDSLIEAAPARTQTRLKGLQWQIENIRSRASSPLGACVKISNMMWTNVLGEDGLAANLRGLSEGELAPAMPKKMAKVLSFQREQDE